MYFYHEGYHETYDADAPLWDCRPRDRSEDDRTYEPIRCPAIFTWLVIVGVALCGIVAAIQSMS